MEKKRCGSQQMRESESCAEHRGQGTAAESAAAAGKKRKKKKKAEADPSPVTQVPPLPLPSLHQQAVPVKKQCPGGSHCSSELSSNSSIGRAADPLTATAATVSSSSSVEAHHRPPSKSTRTSEQQTCNRKPQSEVIHSPIKLPHLKPSLMDEHKCSGLDSDTIESLRWNRERSDEERERERVEEYKRNRRKRYTRHFRVLQQPTQPSPFYAPSESPS